MISMKYASIIAVAAFVAGSFVASPELRAYAAATIGSAEIIDESIRSVDIKNGEVKASDIATNTIGASEIAANSVGASELAGVTKLLFSSCAKTDFTTKTPGDGYIFDCGIQGVDFDDHAIVQMQDGPTCFVVTRAVPATNNVNINVKNVCAVNAEFGTGMLAIMVYDT